MDLSVLESSGGTTLELVIWSIFVGICIGVIAVAYVKIIPGALVRRLLASGAASPDSACTLDSSGTSANPLLRFFIKLSLRDGSYLRKFVRIAQFSDDSSASNADAAADGNVSDNLVNASSADGDASMAQTAVLSAKKGRKARAVTDFDTVRFYIPDDKSFRAEQVYSNRGNAIITALISVLAFLIVALLSFYIVPELISMAQSIF